MNNQSLIYAITKYSLYIIIFFLSWILFYNQIYSGYPSDLIAHINFIDGIIDGTKSIPHPLFHYITYYTHIILSLNIKTAAILINSLLVVFLSIIIHIILNSFISLHVSKYLNILLILIIVYSGTFFLPELGLTKYQYLGNGSIGIWHNVTLFMVKPFAFASFFIFFYAIEKDNKQTKILLFISYLCGIISIFAKPSFIVMFMPMILIYFFYRIFNKTISKQLIIYTLILFSSTLCLLIYQVKITYNTSQKSDIIFAPFEVWNLYSDNIILSLFLANIFVIVFSLIAYKYLSVRSIFAFIMFLISILIFIFFAEKGLRFTDGNFFWSYAIAMQLIYLSYIIDFVNKFNQIDYKSSNLLILCLSLQFISGIYYFIKLFLGGYYA